MRGDRLRLLRQERGFSQDLLARLVKIGNRQIWRYEKGETSPASEVIARIAAVFNVSSDYLLGLSDDSDPNLREHDLTRNERDVVNALRNGDAIEAIKLIVLDYPAKAPPPTT